MSKRHYKQLRMQDREAIEEGLKVKKPIRLIAQEIEVSPSAVTREILRSRRDDVVQYSHYRAPSCFL